jgi:hypothetical protein
MIGNLQSAKEHVIVGSIGFSVLFQETLHGLFVEDIEQFHQQEA